MCRDYSRWQTRQADYRARFENPADNTDDIVRRYTILRNIPPRDLYQAVYTGGGFDFRTTSLMSDLLAPTYWQVELENISEQM